MMGEGIKGIKSTKGIGGNEDSEQENKASINRPVLPIIFLFILTLAVSGYLFWRGVVKKQPFFQKAQPAPSPIVGKTIKGVGIVQEVIEGKIVVKDQGTGIYYQITVPQEVTIEETESSREAKLEEIKVGSLVSFEAEEVAGVRENLKAKKIFIRDAGNYLPKIG